MATKVLELARSSARDNKKTVRGYAHQMQYRFSGCMLIPDSMRHRRGMLLTGASLWLHVPFFMGKTFSLLVRMIPHKTNRLGHGKRSCCNKSNIVQHATALESRVSSFNFGPSAPKTEGGDAIISVIGKKKYKEPWI